MILVRKVPFQIAVLVSSVTPKDHLCVMSGIPAVPTALADSYGRSLITGLLLLTVALCMPSAWAATFSGSGFATVSNSFPSAFLPSCSNSSGCLAEQEFYGVPVGPDPFLDPDPFVGLTVGYRAQPGSLGAKLGFTFTDNTFDSRVVGVTGNAAAAFSDQVVMTPQDGGLLGQNALLLAAVLVEGGPSDDVIFQTDGFWSINFSTQSSAGNAQSLGPPQPWGLNGDYYSLYLVPFVWGQAFTVNASINIFLDTSLVCPSNPFSYPCTLDKTVDFFNTVTVGNFSVSGLTPGVGFQATSSSGYNYSSQILAAVPVPPAAWLFGSALALMGGIRRIGLKPPHGSKAV